MLLRRRKGKHVSGMKQPQKSKGPAKEEKKKRKNQKRGRSSKGLVEKTAGEKKAACLDYIGRKPHGQKGGQEETQCDLSEKKKKRRWG